MESSSSLSVMHVMILSLVHDNNDGSWTCRAAVLVFCGSCMHELTYIISGAIMSKSGDGGSSARQLETNNDGDDDDGGSRRPANCSRSA